MADNEAEIQYIAPFDQPQKQQPEPQPVDDPAPVPNDVQEGELEVFNIIFGFLFPRIVLTKCIKVVIILL